MAAAIEQVERELDAALAGLNGWAEKVLLQKTDRLHELRSALAVQADRIRDMEGLLAREQAEPPDADPKPVPANERWERSWQALDIAAGAVLLASLVAAGVGIAIFAHRFFVLLGFDQ